MKRLLLALLLPSSALAVTHCASVGNDDGVAAPEESGKIPPETDAAGADVDVDVAAPDGGRPRTCADVDFCAVPDVVTTKTLLTSVWGSGANDVWAVGNRGIILHWDGTKWRAVASGTTQTLNAVRGSGTNDVWITSSRRLTLHGTASPSGAWTFAPTIPVVPQYMYEYPDGIWEESMLYAAWVASPSDVWVGGQPYPVEQGPGVPVRYESMWRSATVDGGAGWAPGTPRQQLTIRAIWGSSASDVWLAVDDRDATGAASKVGMLLHGMPDQGVWTWEEVDSQSTNFLRALWGSSATDIWAVGDGGQIRHWTGGAQRRWEIVESPTIEHLHAVWGSGPNDIWAVGDHNAIVHFDGTRWKAATMLAPFDLNHDLHGVWGSGPDDVWIVGNGVLLHKGATTTGTTK